MITMDQLNQLYIDKLERTGSHDQAIRKVWWDAYKKGAEDAISASHNLCSCKQLDTITNPSEDL